MILADYNVLKLIMRTGPLIFALREGHVSDDTLFSNSSNVQVFRLLLVKVFLAQLILAYF
jgi:hypothetical protein